MDGAVITHCRVRLVTRLGMGLKYKAVSKMNRPIKMKYSWEWMSLKILAHTFVKTQSRDLQQQQALFQAKLKFVYDLDSRTTQR